MNKQQMMQVLGWLAGRLPLTDEVMNIAGGLAPSGSDHQAWVARLIGKVYDAMSKSYTFAEVMRNGTTYETLNRNDGKTWYLVADEDMEKLSPLPCNDDRVLLTRCDNKARYHWGQRAWPVYRDNKGDRYCTVSIDDMQVLTGRVLNGTLFSQEEVALCGQKKALCYLMFEGELCYIMPKAFLTEAFGATHKVEPKTDDNEVLRREFNSHYHSPLRSWPVYLDHEGKSYCPVAIDDMHVLTGATPKVEPVPTPLDPIVQLSQHHDEHVPFKGAMYKGELIALSVTMPAGELHVRLD